jgi:alkylhydroperoxidase/carboxymuconolactone decarboxylase family protein YurZ
MTMEAFLEPKTQLLIALGAAAAAKCQNCFTKLYGSADKVAASAEEVRAAVAIGMKVAAKSHDFMAAFMETTTGGTVPARASGGGGAAGCGCSAVSG